MPQEVSTELGRVVERWQQLPLGHALSRAPQLRAVVESLAGEAVPDLGPGVIMDQLTVVVYDTCRDAVASGRSRSGVGKPFPGAVAERMAQLRRAL